MRIEAFIVLILIVVSILNIILFFKIWGMTNNVKEMRDYFLREDARRNVEEEKYFFNSGEKVIYEGRIYEVVENLLQGKCKCKDVETGRLYSLQDSDLKSCNN